MPRSLVTFRRQSDLVIGIQRGASLHASRRGKLLNRRHALPLGLVGASALADAGRSEHVTRQALTARAAFSTW
jgi:hypothetical protein